QRLEHAVLDGVFGNEVDDGDRSSLVLAPGARDALLEFGRVPWQVAIDHHAGGLQVQPGAAAVRAEKNPAVRVVLEGIDLAATASLRDAAGVPGETEIEPLAEFAHQLEHSFPFGEDEDLGPVLAALFQDFLKLAQLRALAVLGIEDE